MTKIIKIMQSVIISEACIKKMQQAILVEKLGARQDALLTKESMIRSPLKWASYRK